MLDDRTVKNKYQFGMPGLVVKGITIHNTGNELSAYENYDLLSKSNLNAGVHILVDEDRSIQFMPLDWCVYHTGKGKDWACKHTIAIEICRSLSDEKTYLKAEENAVEVIKEIMNKYDLSVNDIYFHNDFNVTTYCPHRIFELYGNKENFLRRYFK